MMMTIFDKIVVLILFLTNPAENGRSDKI
jgi:hypothetical protein